MNYGVELGSGAKFHKDRFSHSNVDRGDTQIKTHRQHGDRTSLISFFQHTEIRLKTRMYTWSPMNYTYLSNAFSAKLRKLWKNSKALTVAAANITSSCFLRQIHGLSHTQFRDYCLCTLPSVYGKWHGSQDTNRSSCVFRLLNDGQRRQTQIPSGIYHCWNSSE